MKKVDLRLLDSETSFKIRMEAYLYRDAGIMMEFGKGNTKKLREYRERRIEIIEGILNVNRPFILTEGEDKLMEVGK